MDRLEINGVHYFYDAVEIELQDIDLIDFLSQQISFPKVYWKDRDAQVVHAALGSLLRFDAVPDCASSVRFYGGMRFDPSSDKDPMWEAFPDCTFWLPQFEIIQTEEKTTLLIHSIGKVCDQDLLQSLNFSTIEVSERLSSYIKIDEVPSSERWNRNVECILEKIRDEELQKVVLARRVSLECELAVCPWALFKKLQERAMHATLFVFQMNSDSAFLGATPEKLYSRNERHVQIDAVAGTRLRGLTCEEDVQMALELLHNAKDLREFLIVKEYLTSILHPFSEQISWQNKDCILKNTHVQHLYNRLIVQLKKNVDDCTLIQQLHPTPALGGFPKELSLEAIRELEGFDRGWYGGPVGFISRDHSSIAVAIRSALIRGNCIDLFSGVGIVEASVPASEWEELDQKLRPFLCFLPEHILQEVRHG